MKKNRFLKFALAAFFAAALIPTAATVAFAEEIPEETKYPSEFTHDLYKLFTDDITDFAIDGDNIAVAVDNKLYALYAADDVRKLETSNHTTITDLEYEGGKLYIKTAENIYSYTPEDKTRVEEHEFKTVHYPEYTGVMTVDVNCNYTYRESNKALIYWHNNRDTTVGEGFTKVKNFGKNGVYALKDNKLYKINGEESVDISLDYTNYEDDENIYSGNTAKALQDSSYAVKIGIVKADAYVTKLDDTVIGEKFKPFYKDKKDENGKKKNSTKKSAGVPCLILAESGNASIIATNDGMFITATASITESTYSTHADSRVGKKFYILEDTGVYSRPYVSGATKIDTIKSGSSETNKVKVTESFHLDYINTDFLRVTYKGEDGEEKSGFVVANFLTEYDFSGEENEHKKLPYDKYDDKTNVVTVVVVVVIVALIIIAVLYLAAKMGKSKRKNKKKEKKKKQSDDEDEDEE